MRPRVGHIQFLNCLPLYYGLVKNQQILLDIELIKGTPTELNRKLLARELDISPISSIEYAQNYHDLLLLPDLTVSADGPVNSIYLVSQVPITELDGKRIALTNTSATSVNLLKIIIQQKYNFRCEYFVCPPDLPSMLLEGEAALLIGDHALRAFYQKPPGLYFYDLGVEWKEFTGHKMVYAVWAVRKEFAQEKPHLVQRVYEAFISSMQYSIKHLEEIVKDAARWEIYTPEFLTHYFRGLEFSFDEEHKKGLLSYYECLAKQGIIKPIHQLNFIEVK